VNVDVAITNLDGDTVARINQYSELEVIDPLCDSRTARVTISIYDHAAAEAQPLSRGLKIAYGDVLIFNGIIVQPSIDFAAGTVTIAAHDPTLKLKHHYHRYGDIVVDYGYPVDGTGMRMLIESSIPIEPQLDRDIPGNHILWGYDSSTPQGPKPTTSPPQSGDGVWRRVERGTNVWESLTNTQQTLLGPDFRFRPVDTEHPGVQGVPPSGFMVEFDTADKLGTDRHDSVIFQHNFGQDNAENVNHEPDGDSTRNYWVQVYPGGERNRDDTARRALVHDGDSWDAYGIYGGWESSGQHDSPQVLREKARAWVKAYATPPDFFTVTPRIDRPGVPLYGHDYFVGDVITAQAKRGYRGLNLVGRVLQATIRQVDAAGNTRVELDCAPSLDPLITDPDPSEG
jgi:hypothetical protein